MAFIIFNLFYWIYYTMIHESDDSGTINYNQDAQEYVLI